MHLCPIDDELGRDNLLQVIECKSYLNSRGVTVAALNDPAAAADSRFKLFVDDALRGVISIGCAPILRPSVPAQWMPRYSLGSHAAGSRRKTIAPVCKHCSRSAIGSFLTTSGCETSFTKWQSAATKMKYRPWSRSSYCESRNEQHVTREDRASVKAAPYEQARRGRRPGRAPLPSSSPPHHP